jgi:uncharacterized sulfatase
MQPNILFIVLDTQRRDRLSLYGHSSDTSPNLDHFAQGATIFERAVAPAQWTIPAHASFFTGTYPSTHQLTQAFQQLSGLHPTLAEILQVEGYHTAAFCNNPLLGVLDHGLQRGFDAFYNYAGASPNRPVERSRGALQREFMTQFRQLARYVTNQFAHQGWLFNAAVNPLIVPFWTRMVNFKGSTERSIADLIDYWQTWQAGGAQQPIFAFLNLMGTHTPYYPPANHVDHVAPGLRHDKQASKFIARHNANAAEWLSPDESPMEEWQRHAIYSYYDAEIAHQDEHLGRLFSFLERSGALDNTVVIVVADHGEGHGDHGYKGHSFVVYQELIHVPLFIHFPERFPAGKHITTNVSTRRLFHTILDVLDIKPPLAEDDPNADVKGLSLIASLNGKPDTERGIAFSEAMPPLTLLNVLETRKPHLVERLNLRQVRRGVYDGDHKLALVGEKVEAFYNVAADPLENHNLAGKDQAAEANLQHRVVEFVTQAQALRVEDAPSAGFSDDVLDNLRALGYID